MSGLLGVELREGELVVHVATMFPVSGISRQCAQKHWFASRRASLSKVSELMAHSELKDALAVIELALWKSRIQKEGGGPDSREACHM